MSSTPNNIAIVCIALLVLGATGLASAGTSLTEPPPPSVLDLGSTEVDFGLVWPGTHAAADPLTGTALFPGGAGCLGILLPPDADGLYLVHEHYTHITMLLSWELRFHDGVNWSDWQPAQLGQMPDSDGKALIWEIIGPGPGEYEFELRASLQVPDLQRAGHYHVSAEIDLVAAYT